MRIIEATNLSKEYGSCRALDGLSLGVEEGEIFGFLGPNGAGKTTTIRILSGLLAPTDGRASVAGVDVNRPPAGDQAHRRRRAGDPGLLRLDDGGGVSGVL